MKTLLTASIIALLIAAACTNKSQPTVMENQYPKVIKTKADSFYVTGYNWRQPFGFAIGENDTVSPGTDGYRGGYLQLITQEDTIQFDYTSTPYQQHHTISVISPQDTTLCILRFNQHNAEFTDSYMQEHEGKAQFVIPEAFELANIVWTISPSGMKASNLHKEGKYYQDVMEYFQPFLDHPIFTKLQFADSAYYQNYYSFRENSVCFNFQGDSLLYSGPYYHVFGNFDQFGGLFKELQPLVEDFAIKSNFRQFYQAHLPYYDKLIERQKQLMPVEDMWAWIESEFPAKINAYKVVFSPLIGATHSTQKFYFMGKRTDWFSEALMFTSGPELIDSKSTLDEKEKEGLSSGIVFTEIDHNYVNPVSYKYKGEIDKVFSNRTLWTKRGGDTDHYTTPESVFNEYMTHALFCLYVQERYDRDPANYIIKSREDLMTNRRHYIRFAEFNKKLAELYRSKAEKENIPDLYPKMIEWASNVK
ncbi:DUF4932 domain-containing protein [Rhodocytophaga aerolata]|uniref:DUF4932 domain-containing protein n=1 Tax=Rhodocytophaga aerolata TaxID=455078 RepID=A0ABT8RIE8_9BACT|nr:DUF4932 domain-containing protein [Rhodocytophaga aerolata]MDO1451882.1 DUF4932 domain-containing protein [Rhodocytophaga aerolata]